MRHNRGVPDPDDPRKPDDLTDLSKRSYAGVLKRTAVEFKDDNCTDWAAALTYYGVLAMFPALIALTSLIGLVGNPKKTTDALLGIVGALGPPSAVDTFSGPMRAVAQNQSAGLALILGLRCPVVGLRLRRRVRPSRERHLRGGGGAARSTSCARCRCW